MNNTTIEKPTPKCGSIAVYQRLLPGKRPAKVEVIRAVYDTYRNPEGIAFGRTNNTGLLKIASGVDCLSAEDAATLGQLGLNEREIAHVNRRLLALAGPARARALEMDVAEAKTKLRWIVALAEATPLVTKQVCELVRVAAGQLAVDDDTGAELPLPLQQMAGTHESLKQALAALNRACEEAQSLYKRLPKGEIPDDVVLEFQESWFGYQDLLTTLTVRKSMARPGGWSKLRAQVRAGRIYRKGEASAE